MTAENNIEAGSIGLVAAGLLLNMTPLAIIGVAGIGASEVIKRRSKKKKA